MNRSTIKDGIIPNIFPLLLTAAIIGYAGIKLEITVGIVFVVAFGIAVDNTIHFIGRYGMERFKGLSKMDSLSFTLHETGRAIFLTSVVLFLGFIQLTSSSFIDAQAVGILLGIMLFFALLADLFLGPLLILKLHKSVND